LKVELLRFVTAYGTGLEAFVDLTPYSPFLNSVALRGNVTFFSFIDTWVGNDTKRDEAIYLNNVTGVCSNTTSFAGNGWSLTADLLYWPRKPDLVDVRPHTSITLASGTSISSYPIGQISMQKGTLVRGGKSVRLHDGIDMEDLADASVYSCKDEVAVAKTANAALLGYIAKRAHQLQQRNETDSGVQHLQKEFFEHLAPEVLTDINVTEVFDNGTVRGSYNTTLAKPNTGVEVFFSPADVYTDAILDDGETHGENHWWNMSVPLEPVGRVTSARNGSIELLISSQKSCLPQHGKLELPKLLVPINDHILNDLRELLHDVVQVGLQRHTSATSKERPTALTANSVLKRSDHHASNRTAEQSATESASAATMVLAAGLQEGGPPLLITPKNINEATKSAHQNQNDDEHMMPQLVPVVPVGKLDLRSDHSQQREVSLIQTSRTEVTEGTGTESEAKHFSKGLSDHAAEQVCVITQNRSGNVFQRNFDIPRLGNGDRVLVQLAVTGHGWSSTTEQCGEYCHAVYSLRLNGQDATNVTEFRDDCKHNPVGKELQHGTWWESRNGWCPGSVMPGLYLDVTPHAKQGANRVSLDVTVWSNVTGRYEPYTDYGGFALDDAASLSVGLSLFVYDRVVVDAVRKQGRGYTAAEVALRKGISDSSRLHLQPLFAQQRVDSTSRDEGAVDDGAFNFEETAPWYSYNSTSDGLLERSLNLRLEAGESVNSQRLFDDKLVQGASRQVQATLLRDELPSDWSQVGLHLRLSKPPGALEYDSWDRVASLGLLFNTATSGPDLVLRPTEKAKSIRQVRLATGTRKIR
jgi:hypothetical protein